MNVNKYQVFPDEGCHFRTSHLLELSPHFPPHLNTHTHTHSSLLHSCRHSNTFQPRQYFWMTSVAISSLSLCRNSRSAFLTRHPRKYFLITPTAHDARLSHLSRLSSTRACGGMGMGVWERGGRWGTHHPASVEFLHRNSSTPCSPVPLLHLRSEGKRHRTVEVDISL